MGIKVVFFDIGDTLVSKKAWLPKSQDCIKSLRENAIRIGLISNTANLDREQLGELLPDDFLLENFDQGIVLLSSEIGIEKPSLSLFLLAIQHAGVSPWETMFVGESLAETIAAQAAGMRSARISNADRDFPILTRALIESARN